MMDKRIALIGIFIFAMAVQPAHAKNAFGCDNNFLMLQITDTLLPISVIATNKLNIMMDLQKELFAIQWIGLNREDRTVILTDSTGKIYEQKQMFAGSTIVYFETQTLYEGNYILKISDQLDWIYNNIIITKPQ